MNNQDSVDDERELQHDAAEQEEKLTVFDWASACLNESLGADKPEEWPCSTVFEHGLYHGNSEFTSLFSGLKDDEEHRTSVYMGCVSSHLSWYHVLAELSGRKEVQKCAWGVMPNSIEVTRGSDFGVLFEVDSAPNEPKKYNIAYFQAKLLVLFEDGSQRVKINQIPTGYASKPEIKERADIVFDQWCTSNNEVALEAQKNPEVHHQVVKLAVTDYKLRGLDTLKDSREYEIWSSVHYVIWMNGADDPITTPLYAVREALKNREKVVQCNDSGISKSKIEIPIDKEPKETEPNGITAIQTEEKKAPKRLRVSLPEFLASGQTAGADGWALLSSEDVKEFVKNWTVLGTRWMVVESSSGGMAEDLGVLAQGVVRNVPKVTGAVHVAVPRGASKPGRKRKIT